jgi:uncharacterized protein YjiS (DUF1127 family)
MTTLCFEALPRTGRRAAGRRRRVGAARRLMAHLRMWRRRAKERAELAALTDRMLADIGITRAEAQFLSGKPFWRD